MIALLQFIEPKVRYKNKWIGRDREIFRLNGSIIDSHAWVRMTGMWRSNGKVVAREKQRAKLSAILWAVWKPNTVGFPPALCLREL